jgi:secretory phospholipase A2
LTPYPNPDYIKTANGCGSKGIIVDADLLPKPQMELCCDAHDYCYDTCSSGKSNCDDTFKNCLLEVCGSGKDVKSIYCKATADLFYDIVKDIGCSSYIDAQKNTCLCP